MRPLRNFVPGVPAHILHRGNNRQEIFTCEGDFLLFLRCIEEAAAKFQVAVNSYVLMTNHVHLLVTPSTVWGISKSIQSAARRYVGYFNSRYERTGTLWEGRFHSTAINTDRYLLACHRYIDMNPVRARLVSSPEKYTWSSHGCHAAGKPDSMVTPHPLITGLAREDAARQIAYRRLFEQPIEVDELEIIRKAVSSGRSLGGEVLQPPRRAPGRPRKKGV